MNKENWVAMFKEVGISEPQMKSWHQFFEKKHPEDHEEFLKWLGISDSEVNSIRDSANKHK